MQRRESQVRAAVITPPGEGGIGIIALVGRDAAGLVDRFFEGTRRQAADLASGSVAHGRIVRNGEIIDEVIVAHLGSGLTQSGEPRIEVNCHGGVAAVRSVLRCVEDAGAMVVDPKELLAPAGGQDAGAPLCPTSLSRRALAALPRARTRLAALMLLHQASGTLAQRLRAIRMELADNAAPERAQHALRELLGTALLGRALLQPPRVGIVGPPNTGKSTLLNALLEKERVLVHGQAGTTRDIVSEVASINGMPFEFMDSAGIRTPQGEIEADAIERARRLIERSQVILLVLDVVQDFADASQILALQSEPERAIIIGNKIDLLAGPPGPIPVPAHLAAVPQVFISAKERSNIEGLEAALLAPYRELITECERGSAIVFDNITHEALSAVANTLRNSGSAEAARELDRLTGAP